jgi:4-amino-4-deoxy-L-arabinose transferase-like glycosyltransferase/Tfp pilus assembly protein PilF
MSRDHKHKSRLEKNAPARQHPAGSRTSTRVRLLLVVLAVGLGLRIANLADISDSPPFTRPVIDGQAYDQWALAIIGKADNPDAYSGLRGPFYQDPLYPYFLAGIYGVFGHSYWAVYLIQLMLAVTFLWLVYDTTRLLFDWRAGLVAAAIAALYKPFIFYESRIEKTALAVFLTALFLWLFARTSNHRRQATNRKSLAGSWLWPAASGATLGLAALTRANTLLFAPLLPVAYLLVRLPTPARTHLQDARRYQFSPVLACIIGVLLVIAPVSIRNTVLAHEFTLTTTQAGQNFFIGNSPYNSTGQYAAPPWVRPTPEFEQIDFAGYANKTAGKTLSHSAVSLLYTRAALNWASSHFHDFVRLLWRKTVLYFNNYEVPDNDDLYSFARYSWVLRLPLVTFDLVFALGVAGMVLLARGLRRISFVVFYFGTAVSVIVFFVLSRYRVPALPALLPFAGAMLPWLSDEYRARSARRGRRGSTFPTRLAGGLALIAAGFGLTLYPIHHSDSRSEAAQGLVNLGVHYYHDGDTARAVASLEEALRTYPGQAEASRNLGIIMFDRGNTDRAFQLLADAARANPATASTHFFLGRIYEDRGQLDSAANELERAVALAPEQTDFRFGLAITLMQMKKYGQAIVQYDTLVRLAPRDPLVRQSYAVCLYNAGRTEEAHAQNEAARRLGGPVNPGFDSLLRPRRSPAR